MDLNPLFEFVQVAMGNRSSLLAYMDGADWQSLFDGCQRQAIAGIGFAALERLPCPHPTFCASLTRLTAEGGCPLYPLRQIPSGRCGEDGFAGRHLFGGNGLHFLKTCIQ